MAIKKKRYWGWNKGKKWSKEIRMKMSEGRRGSKNHAWKGDDAGYVAIHAWLRKNFGKAEICENLKCPFEIKTTFDWALKRGKKYRHRRENFIQLCRRCHWRYDNTLFKIWL